MYANVLCLPCTSLLMGCYSQDLVDGPFVKRIVDSLPSGTKTVIQEFKGTGYLAHIDQPENYTNVSLSLCVLSVWCKTSLVLMCGLSMSLVAIYQDSGCLIN